MERWHKDAVTLVFHQESGCGLRSVRQGRWSGLSLCVPFSVLMLMVRWQEGHLTCKKNPVQLMPTGSVPEQVRRTEAGCDPASTGKNGH